MQEVEAPRRPGATASSTSRRGGNHLMFEKLKQQAEAGREGRRASCTSPKSDPIKVEIPVKAATYNPKTALSTEGLRSP